MEKVLDLRMPGVQELGREELREVEGGDLTAIALNTLEMYYGSNSNGSYMLWYGEDGEVHGVYYEYYA